MDSPEREAEAARARAATARLLDEGVEGVALTYVDNAGVTRVKAVPVAGLPHAAAWGVGMSPVFDVFCVDDSITTGELAGGPVGDLRLHPDLDRLTRLAAQPGWAWAPADRYTQDGAVHPGCQRSFAKRIAARAREVGLEVRMGFEVEWVVGTEDEGRLRPACAGPAYGMTRLVELSDYCREILGSLSGQSVEVLQIHPEYADGQLEVSVAPSDPVGAADLMVLVRETVRAVSHRHGWGASFAPAVVAGTVGNGGHLHVSLRRDGLNLLTEGPGPYGMHDAGESFLAGVLEALPALVGIGAPSVSSYLRLVPSRWAGAFQCWGRENREAALRIITGSTGQREEAANAEVKCFDASANPYLVVGAVLAVGLASLDKGLRLPAEVPGDPALLSDGELERLEVKRLPQSAEEALSRLEESTVLRSAMGESLYDAFAAVRRAEIAMFAGRPPEEIAAATRWRY
jgi:glutamine synthetase